MKEKNKWKKLIPVVNYYIQWTCNQTVKIILKMLDIKKLIEMTTWVNRGILMGPN